MKLLPLFIFWCLWFLNYSTRAAFSPILPLIEDNLSLSHGEAGGLYTSLSIGYSLSMFAAGRFAFVWGYKRTVVIGFLGISLALFGIQWVESYPTFHVLFFLIGMATGGYMPSIIPIITETYDSRHWGKAIGLHDSAASFSIFLVPILVVFGLHFFPWRRLFLVLGITALLLPIYFWKVSIEPKGEMSQRNCRYTDLFKRRTVWIMSLLSIFASGSVTGLYAILPLYLIKERGIDFSYANTIFGISRIGGIFVSVLSGFLTDRYGYKKILMLSLLLTGLSTIGLSLAFTLPLILVFLFLQAAFAIAYFPPGLSAVSKLTSLSERSVATGMVFSFGSIFGMGIVPFLLGLIADYFSFQIGIFFLGLLTTLSSLLVKFLKEKEDP
jgi:NNP family nitrate/nitrite transporter-like MFS transporter